MQIIFRQWNNATLTRSSRLSHHQALDLSGDGQEQSAVVINPVATCSDPKLNATARSEEKDAVDCSLKPAKLLH